MATSGRQSVVSYKRTQAAIAGIHNIAVDTSLNGEGTYIEVSLSYDGYTWRISHRDIPEVIAALQFVYDRVSP